MIDYINHFYDSRCYLRSTIAKVSVLSSLVDIGTIRLSVVKGINMETEIELKFFVPLNFASTLQNKIQEHKILQHSCRELINTYFDTPDHWLRQHDIGLRIRCFDEVYVQTVKTAGRVVAGLHQRPEYNAEHHSNLPDLNLHPADIWPQQRELDQLQNELTALFTTNYQRELWLIAMPDGSQVEVVFDQGWVEAKDKKVPICEVELELKSGQTDALFSLARQLSEVGNMRLGNLSKAALGYRLASGELSQAVFPLQLVETKPTDSVETCFIHSLEHALSHWHHHEEIYVARDEIAALQEIRQAISFIRQLLTVYGGVVPRRASALLRQELQWLEEELSWLTEYSHIDELLRDRGHAFRKLDARKFLMAELTELQHSLPQRDDMLRLFNSSRYTRLLLDLCRWILTRDWQPFLDEKAQAKMARSIRGFSIKQLERVWQELAETFSADKAFTSEDYIAQQHRLMRSLYTGIGFASLFDAQERSAFRLPWADLLHGVEDLMTLKALEKRIEQLAGEEQEQLKRWVSRQESSILHAMEQTRHIGLETSPYWRR